MTISTANDLIDRLVGVTGCSNRDQLKIAVDIGEERLRTLDLPLLASNPYDLSSIGIAGSDSGIPIPNDMRTPIQFFKNGTQFTTSVACTGSAGANTVYLTTAPIQNLVPGMSVTGTGIAVGTTVVAYNNQTATLSANNLTNINTILTFKSNPTISSITGPWIVYNRISAKEGIALSLSPQLNSLTSNIYPRSSYFWELRNRYFFYPALSPGDLINMYYYKSVPKLFSPLTPVLLSPTATISNVINGGSYWYANIILPQDPASTIDIGDTVSATSGTGTLNTNEAEITTILGARQFKIRKFNDGTPIVAGDVTNLMLNATVQSNIILSSTPTSYFYTALIAYYTFNNTIELQQKYEILFNQTISTIEEQNTKGIYSGGETTFTSPYLPRGRGKRLRSIR